MTAARHPVLVVIPGDQYAVVAARLIASAIAAAVAERGRCALALSGGSTPIPVYRELARLGQIHWDRVDVFFGDERAVPPDDPASNYRMARESLLDRVALPAGNVHRMPADRPDRETAAAEYGALLPSPLDVLLLGMGEDGHTASLFPGSAVLAEKERRVVAVTGPKAPVERLTITPRVIAAARASYVLIRGRDKAAVVARAVEGSGDPAQLPVQFARGGTWLLDDEAAGTLRQVGARGDDS